MATAPPAFDKWQPLSVVDLQRELGTFRQWVLCGGYSIDWLVNKATRQHDDIDVGVFRSDLSTCLKAIAELRVYLCDPPGSLRRWDGKEVPKHVHDIWIADAKCSHWILQIMVYDDEDENVIYRRDKRLSWPKGQHAIEVRGLSILNPIITLLFKLHRADMRNKDCVDVETLIGVAASCQNLLSGY